MATTLGVSFTAEVVGEGFDPTIRPHDIVVMPEDMGGESYMVQGVDHEFSGEDGYTTTIFVGGVYDLSEESRNGGPTGPEDGVV